MSEISGLIEKLNPKCRRIIERAAEVCVSQSHFNVELEHVLLQLIEETDTDLIPVFRSFSVSQSSATAEILDKIDTFKRGNSRTPALSPYIMKALQDAFIISSIRLQEPYIRTASFFLAILEDDALRGMTIEAAPELVKIEKGVLSDNLLEFCNISK